MFAYLYTGFAVQTTRQIVSWTSFLYWDHRIRYAFKGGDRTQKLTGVQVVVSAFLSSILNISMGTIKP
jgi:solute carrier family 25 citrate transporter 1